MNRKEYSNLNNEGHDGYNLIDAIEEQTAEARYQLSLNADGWTLEGTKTRRAAWNEEAMRAKKAGRKVNLLEMEKKMGFTLNSLKAAIAHYNM